jgi:hypothetical protein
MGQFATSNRFTPGLLGHDRRCAGEIAHWRGAQDVVASARLRRKPRDGHSESHHSMLPNADSSPPLRKRGADPHETP